MYNSEEKVQILRLKLECWEKKLELDFLGEKKVWISRSEFKEKEASLTNWMKLIYIYIYFSLIQD